MPDKVREVPGVRELHVAVSDDSSFDEIVEILREVWVVPELGGFRACDPCRSGIDRLVIEDPLFHKFAG
jgi:hypothetical protein